MQPALDRLPIQYGVIFAAHHEREVCQINDDGSCPVLPIQPHQSEAVLKLVSLKVASESAEPLTQLLTVASIAPVAETAEPTFNCEPARRRCGSARLPRACVRCNQQHRPGSSDAGGLADPLCVARLEASLPPASHRGL